MKKSIIIALFSFSLVQYTIAQVAIGLKTGVNFASVHTTDLIDQAAPDFNFTPGWNVGLVTEINVGNYFALQPEVNWVQKGFTWNESVGIPLGNVEIPLGAAATFRTNYLEVPLLVKLKLGNERIQGYVAAGPSFGYAMNAKIITRPRLFFEFDPIETKVNLDNLNYERFDLSATGGLGIQVNFHGASIFADARYTHGFTELYDFPVVNEQIKNKGIALSAGVLFNLQTAAPKAKRPGTSRPTMRR